MILHERTREYADVRLNYDEMLLLNNALNEVCNGIHFEDGEFQTRLSGTKEEGRILLKEIGTTLDAMKK